MAGCCRFSKHGPLLSVQTGSYSSTLSPQAFVELARQFSEEPGDFTGRLDVVFQVQDNEVEAFKEIYTNIEFYEDSDDYNVEMFTGERITVEASELVSP